MVKRVDLVPHVTPHPKDSTSSPPVQVLERQLREVLQAGCALVGGEVRRALHSAVHRRQGANVHARGREPPGAVDRGLGRVVQQSEQEEPDGVLALREVLGVHQEGHVAAVGGGRQEVSVGEAEEAGIVVHGGFLAERAELLRVLEACGNAVLAGGGVDVPAAEGKGVHHVRHCTGGTRGEEGRLRRGFLGEACRELTKVGLVGAGRRVVARVAADLPLGIGERKEEKGQQHDGHGG